MESKNYTDIYTKVPLFAGISPADYDPMFACLNVQIRPLKKGEAALVAGSSPDFVGIVLEGALQVVRDSVDGKRSLLALLGPADIFAEVFCCAGVQESPVSVLADQDSMVLLLPYTRILGTCSNMCAFHTRLVQNMLQVLAQKNLHLQTRMEFISYKSIRMRIISYLHTAAPAVGQYFEIPFDRQNLADYLCVDRSALSRELAALKKEGVIDYWKNKFKLL